MFAAICQKIAAFAPPLSIFITHDAAAGVYRLA